jgi:hypothetical protein
MLLAAGWQGQRTKDARQRVEPAPQGRQDLDAFEGPAVGIEVPEKAGAGHGDGATA